MTDCPNCEHHKKRAQLWRDEAYKQAGHPLSEREWVGLTDKDWSRSKHSYDFQKGVDWAEAMLKGKNT